MSAASGPPQGDRSAWHAAQQWLNDDAEAVDTADLGALGRLCTGVTVHAPTGMRANGPDVAALSEPLVLAPDPIGRPSITSPT